MIFTTENTAGKKVEIFDAQGSTIPWATKYNTKTREVTMFLVGKKKNGQKGSTKLLMKSVGTTQWKPLSVKIKIPGSYIVVDGTKY